MTDTTPLYQVEDGWLEMVSGIAFYFGDPTMDMIRPEDIAYSLSRLCRYNGHVRRWYTVAEHTCIMSDWIMTQPWATARDGLTALHHDDAEYIIGDLPRPIKVTMPQFKALEEILDQKMAMRFGTIWPFPGWLKEADSRILMDERAEIMNPSTNIWGTDEMEPLGVDFMPISGRFCALTKWQWLRRHHKLTRMMVEESMKKAA